MRCGRYAPSPTGPLHLGNLRTALLAWLQIRLVGGRFILRIDDLDLPRNRAGGTEQIISDLRWLGLDWDEGPDTGGPHGPYLQQLRTGLYREQFRKLLDRRLVYPCSCSRKDIRLAQSAPHPDSRTAVYPGTCRPESPTGFPASQHPGPGSGAWRFLTAGITVDCADRLLGGGPWSLESEVGDFVVQRRDDLFAYQFATVADDGLMGVTDVVRGADLLDSMSRQAALFDSLGFFRPDFWHVPLMQDRHGNRMSKRDGAESVQKWRLGGHSPDIVVGMLAHSAGIIDRNRPISCQELLAQTTVQHFCSALGAHEPERASAQVRTASQDNQKIPSGR